MSKKRYKFSLNESELRLVLFLREIQYADVYLPVRDGNAMLNGIKIHRKSESFKRIRAFCVDIEELAEDNLTGQPDML